MFHPFTTKTLEYVDTPNGKLRGYKQNDIYAFLGVPYGECKRWQTATPAKPWKGIRNALHIGTRAFPIGMIFTPWDSCGVAHEAYNYSEDCLNLNVWTPSIDKGAKKPVMVWIHGGGYVHGSSMEMQAHDGENLSKFGDVVVVTVNHRLNVFGFMDASRFGEKYANSGNAGMSDLVLALKWVKEHISSFGGDPDNVLIYGQSGGGGKVRVLLQVPEAAGLFHKAVIMSGALGRPTPDGVRENESADYANLILDRMLEKYNTDDIAVLEALEPEELLDLVAEVTPTGAEVLSWHPIANEWYPGAAEHIGPSEFAKTVPVMIGTTITEFPPMRVFNKHSYTEEQKEAIVREAFPDQDTDTLIKLFREAWPNKSLTDVTEMYGFMDFRLPTIEYVHMRAKTATAPTYVYIFALEFDQNGGRSAWHCADIPIVFHNAENYPENFHNRLMDGLQDAICGSWVNFAHNSDPNNDYLKVQWPAYTEEERAVMVFDKPCEVREEFDRELVYFLSGLKQKPLEQYAHDILIN